MLLTLTTTHTPATDLGYLLHKNPARSQAFPLSFGQVHVFYPEVGPARCTAALLLDVDPVALVRKDRGVATLDQYVNDRPYVASSFLSVAIAQVFGTALAGRSRERPALADQPLPLEATLAVVPCREGDALLRRLFEPLGYEVSVVPHALDPQFPAWGASAYYTVHLAGTVRLRDLLSHLYVLVPVLDDEKHYWVGEEEVEKLLRHGAGWLATHPARALITHRYLKHQRPLARAALARLAEEDNPDPDSVAAAQAEEEAAVEKRISLHEQRLGAVVAALQAIGARRVLDLGCGEGRLIRELLKAPEFTAILGLDVAPRVLEQARERLHLDRLARKDQGRVALIQGALTYRDARLAGYDAAAVVEVIEHLDPPRLAAFERVLFEFARPGAVVLTTPNAEYNVRWETLPAGQFRHRDHRFEWRRAEFQAWATAVAARFGYAVRFAPVGPDDPEVGAPTQMAVFTRATPAPAAGAEDAAHD
ncbi:MAG TPA: 3' terminal RNA ribose 2'-O-methyltransferase Hen1 [Chloroflexia bacterium]|nr:3' terminal RNA ribose 2'-O-methyltransferase Hen1 [Chloroflexia bacterium]